MTTQPTQSLADAATDTIGRQLTVEEILDKILAELITLVDANGELVIDPEASIADQSKAGRAQELSDRLDQVTAAMRAAMWRPLFRGLPTEEFEVFDKQYLPAKRKPDDQVDLTDYENRLIAVTAIDPEMSVDDVVALRKKLGLRAFAGLLAAARQVCVSGGVDVPKSPTFSLGQRDSTPAS